MPIRRPQLRSPLYRRISRQLAGLQQLGWRVSSCPKKRTTPDKQTTGDEAMRRRGNNAAGSCRPFPPSPPPSLPPSPARPSQLLSREDRSEEAANQ